jgi:exosortase/archaeosortase family protein
LAWGLVLGLVLVHGVAAGGGGAGWVTEAFCRPAAWLASLHLGCPLQEDAAGVPLLVHSTRTLRITPACSGFDFFLLAFGLATWGWARARGFRWRQLPAWAVAAYALTVAANASRLAATVWLIALGRHLFPEDFRHPLHLAAGVLVFLPLLILLHHVLERLPRHAPT